MPQRQSSRRHQRSRNSQNRHKKSDYFSTRVSKAFRRLSDQFRQWRRRQRRSQQAAALEWAKAQEALELKGLKRELSKRKLPRLDLAKLLSPQFSEGLSTREAVANLLRCGAFALLQLTVVSLLLSSIPVRLGSPEWYLQALTFVAESGPVIILALGIGALGVFVAPTSTATARFKQRLLRTSRSIYFFVIILLPLQLALTGWLFAKTFGEERIQLSGVRSEASALIAGAQRQSSKNGLVSYLGSRNITVDAAAVETAPLAKSKDDFVKVILGEQGRRERAIRSQTQSKVLNSSVGSLRLFVSLIILAIFLRIAYGAMRASSIQTTP